MAPQEQTVQACWGTQNSKRSTCRDMQDGNMSNDRRVAGKAVCRWLGALLLGVWQACMLPALLTCTPWSMVWYLAGFRVQHRTAAAARHAAVIRRSACTNPYPRV